MGYLKNNGKWILIFKQWKGKPNKCYLDKDTGNCRGIFERFYFNKQSGKCEQFIYG
jgi:hypothetical protein